LVVTLEKAYGFHLLHIIGSQPLVA
jgi:hypothetical protein